MKRRGAKRVVLWAAGIGSAVLLARFFVAGPSPADSLDPGLIAGRVWVETEPESLKQKVHRMLMVEEIRLGIFDESSFYAGRHEIFEWRRNDGALKLVFPQDRRTAEITFSLSRCDDLFPYDLCLDLSENPWGGPKRYYGLMDPDGGEDDLVARRMRAAVEDASR